MKSKDNMYNDMVAQAKIDAPTIHWVPQAPQQDVLTRVINELYRLEGLVEYTNSISSLERYKKFISNSALIKEVAESQGLDEADIRAQLKLDLDAKLAEWGFYRKLATKSMGGIRLEFPNTTTINAPLGAILKTLDEKRYLTTETLAGDPVPVGGSYIIYVMAEAETAGSAFNVPEGTYFRSSDIPTLIRGIAMHEIINGQDEESDLDFIDRFIKARTQEGVGSKSWLLRTVMAYPQVVDANVYGTGDEHFERDYGADVWVYPLEIPMTILEKAMLVNSKHTLEKAPLMEHPTIIGVSANPNGTPIFTIIDSVFKRSIFDIVEVEPLPTQEWVEYTVDKVMQDVQAILRKGENWILGGQDLILVKKGYAKSLDVGMSIEFNADLTDEEIATCIETIKTDLNTFFVGGTGSDGTLYTRKKLGQVIDWSDVEEVALRVEGVDRIDKDTFIITIDGIEQDDPVPIDFNAFAILGNVNIVQL
jgi:hypothetical protein